VEHADVAASVQLFIVKRTFEIDEVSMDELIDVTILVCSH